ncbi:hypothetical protein, partial [Pseudomaricurvus alcaniphilus]|uniref:hypothetical protein n=1 Tax=Pseudomaricurvus alcaniphilus TaxID=1166482 RepID=UPI001A9FB28C
MNRHFSVEGLASSVHVENCAPLSLGGDESTARVRSLGSGLLTSIMLGAVARIVRRSFQDMLIPGCSGFCSTLPLSLKTVAVNQQC